MRKLIYTLALGMLPMFAHSQILVNKMEYMSIIDKAKNEEKSEDMVFDNLLVSDEATTNYILTNNLTNGHFSLLKNQPHLVYEKGDKHLFVNLVKFEYEEGMLARMYVLVFGSQKEMFIEHLTSEENYTHYKIDTDNDIYPEIDLDLQDVFVRGSNVCFITDGVGGFVMFIFETKFAKDAVGE